MFFIKFFIKGMSENSKRGWKTDTKNITLIVGTPQKPTQFQSGQVIINKKATKKNLEKLIEINNDGLKKPPKKKITNDATDGGLLKGKPHYDKNGNPMGGIPGVVDKTKPIETEGEEFVLSKEASEKHWKELSEINTSTGGVPINPPNYIDENPEIYAEGGNIIEFNPNRVPSKRILNYGNNIRKNHPEIWKLGGNIFGNQAFKNLMAVSKRGYWLESEEWMYIKWRSYVARHIHDFRIEGVIAMLKWADTVEKGWAYMKDLIEQEIDKREKRDSDKMAQGGVITYKNKYNTKYGYRKNKSHSLEQISKDTGISLKGLQQIYNKGIGAYKTNPESVRPTVKSKEQWAMARVYSAVMGGDAAIVDKNELKMVDGGMMSSQPPTENQLWNQLVKHYDGGGNVHNLINQGIVELKMHDTKPEHAQMYGLNSEKPLYIQSINVIESERLKGNGTQVLKFIEEYALENGNDVVFGHINQKSKPSINMIKEFLRKNGYVVNETNNDFYRYINSDIRFENGGLIAPNGKPTNLTPEQYKLVRTPEFKAWFGDWENDPKNASKVVDENGEPLLMYHGTDVEFFEFKKREKSFWDVFWFTPNFDTAKMYSKSNGKNGIVLKCFLNVKNPSKKYPFDLKEYDGFIDYFNQMDYINWKSINHIKIVQVVSSNQIKLADGTNTTFDSNNPDIRFENGGNTKNEIMKKNTEEISQIKLEIMRLQTKAFKMMPNSPKQKEVIKQIDILRSKLESLGGKFANGGSTDAKDTVTVDIPLMIRMLELSREDIHSDAELHQVVERLLDLKNKPVLTMDDYEYIADVEHKHINKMAEGGTLETDPQKLISQAHYNLTVRKGRKEYAPSAYEIQEEIDRMVMEGQFGSNNI